MNDTSNEVRDTATGVFATNDEPVILNLQEESAELKACEYCGHYPCGCGG